MTTAAPADTDEVLVLAEIHTLTTIPLRTLQHWHATADPRSRDIGLFKLPNGRVVARQSSVDAFLDRCAKAAS